MARIRSIKPEFWTDEKIVDLSPVAKLLYIGIWNFADDDGFIADSARQIALRVFPGNDYDVASALEELVSAGLIVRYTSDQGAVLGVPRFRDHQTPNRPTPTKFTGIAAAHSRTTHTPPTDDSVSTHGALPLERRGEEGKGEEVCAPAARKDDLFEEFWKAWPLKKGKKPARTAFEKAIKSGVNLETILAGVERYKREIGPSPDWSKVKWPQGWLNDARWEDESAPVIEIQNRIGPGNLPEGYEMRGHYLFKRGMPTVGGPYGMTNEQANAWIADAEEQARRRRA